MISPTNLTALAPSYEQLERSHRQLILSSTRFSVWRLEKRIGANPTAQQTLLLARCRLMVQLMAIKYGLEPSVLRVESAEKKLEALTETGLNKRHVILLVTAHGRNFINDCSSR